ncbi:MAG: ornithine cyclodeaminase family protein, partial [Paracoccaceae bacterium]
LDFALVTKWKTAADSLLAARRLARPESRDILIIGAGSVAGSMIHAYSALFPNARFSIWNRTLARAQEFAACHGEHDVRAVNDLPDAARRADIIATATMSRSPVLKGEWLRPGQHVDLIGAFRADMREADDAAMRRARVFVDCVDSTIGEIGELIEPMKSGALRRDDVLADFYDLDGGVFSRKTDDEITICKNGGGAHLDLMTCRYILDATA